MGEKKLGDIFSHFDTKHECYTSVNGKCRDYAQRGAVKIEFVDNFSFWSSYPADRQTDKGRNITSLAKLINNPPAKVYGDNQIIK